MESNDEQELTVHVTEQQSKVVQAIFDSHTVQSIISGPGCGKTATLAKRIVFSLSQGYDPSQILVLSLTNKAVNSIKKEFISAVEPDIGREAAEFVCKSITILTFSAFQYKIVSSAHPVKYLNASNSEALVNIDVSEDTGLEVFGYETFDSVKQKCLELQSSHLQLSYKLLFVDEFQDLSSDTFEMLRLLLSRHNVHLTVAGDPDHTSFGFISSIDPYNELFRLPVEIETTFLSENFRSTDAIVQFSNTLASVPIQYCHNSGGETPRVYSFVDIYEQIDFVFQEIESLRQIKSLQYSDFLLLTQTRSDLDKIEKSSDYFQKPVSVVNKTEQTSTQSSKLLEILKAFYSPEANKLSVITCLLMMFRVNKSSVKELAAHGLSVAQMTSTNKKVQSCLAILTKKIEFYNNSANWDSINDPLFILNDVLQFVSDINGYRKVCVGDQTLLQVSHQFYSQLVNANNQRLASPSFNSITLSQWLLARSNESMVLDSFEDTREFSQAIQVSTVHSAKGLVSPVVFVLAKHRWSDLARYKNDPSFNDLGVSNHIDNKIIHRYYVACTRATSRLYFLESTSSSESWYPLQQFNRSYSTLRPNFFAKSRAWSNSQFIWSLSVALKRV